MDRRRVLTGLFTFLGPLLIACGAAATPDIAPAVAQEAATTTSQTEQSPKVVQIKTTRSLKFEPSDMRVEQGERVEFVITDTSGFGHTFTVATSRGKQNILKDVSIKGNETKSVILTFPGEASTLNLFAALTSRRG